MRRAVAVFLLAACASGGSSSTLVLLRKAGEGAEPAGIAHRSPEGQLLLTAATEDPRGAPAGWDLIAVLAPGSIDKLGSPSKFLRIAERSGGPDPIVDCMLQLDSATMPGNEGQVKSELRAAGFEPQTLSGNVVTGRIRPSGLGRTLGLPWVHHLALAGPVHLR